MASDVYVVKGATTPVNVRTGPGTAYKAVGSKVKDDTVKVFEEKNGWCKISESSDMWISKSYLRATETTTANTGGSASGNGEDGGIVYDPSGSQFTAGDTSTMSSTELQKEIKKSLRAFGSPPRFTEETDPHYISGLDAGRVYTETIMMNPTIVSLLPCTVKYLPKFNKKEQENFVNRVVGLAGNDADLVSRIKAEATDTGSLFTTKSAYNEYIKIVNMLCRMCSIYLGIGDKTAPGTNIPYKKYDWGFYTTDKPMTNSGIKHIFDTITQVGDTVMDDSAYIHFFANQPGVDISENMSTSVRDSAIANLFNGSISDVAKDLNFLVGGALSDEANSEIDNILSSAGDNTFSQLLKFGKEYFNGARLVFPQMLDNVTYGKSMSLSMRLAATSGTPESIYLQCIVPACHILAFGCPRQVSESMYTYPLLCRAVCKGRFNSELAVVSDISIERGGDGGRWTIDGLPTEFDLRFTITPLYSNLMVTSSDHPLLFMSNTSLIEYLSVMCGVDLKKANNDLKWEAAKNSILLAFTDKPVNLARSVIDNGMVNFARNFAQLP